MEYQVENISAIVGGRLIRGAGRAPVEHLLIDSRKVYSPSTSLFFALRGPRRDGHHYIAGLYQRGVRSFVISEEINAINFPEGSFIRVFDTLEALQKLAAFHRRQFTLPVIGITGSNGKTIVKEWLYQLLQGKFHIVRSPRSYNSQIGVPLSVWQLNSSHQLAIFEAGISQPGEMDSLEKIIQPTIGILTTIGEAHSENFVNREEKLNEKLRLFAHSNKIIARGDDAWITRQMLKTASKNFLWGKNQACDLQLIEVSRNEWQTRITVQENGERFSFVIPFADDASVENSLSCCSLMLVAGIDKNSIVEGMNRLQPVSMRLELKKAINQCAIINDSYSADLSSLNIALNFLDQQSAGTSRTVILSDFLQTGLPDDKLYAEIGSLLRTHGVNKVIAIGAAIGAGLQLPANIVGQFYHSTEDFLAQFRTSQFREETILVKGARLFQFEKIVHALEQKVHQTVLEINLNAIVHNLKEYQRSLHPSTKIMAMVKAFAYGSGGAEIAGILQYHQVDYFGVAYADEGVELRRAGIILPVMIMNPEVSSFDAIVDNSLEPVIYSTALLDQFDSYLRQAGIQQYPIHIELETGMNRLGFDPGDIGLLATALQKTNSVRVRSIFSHLAASEDPLQDEFTTRQHQLLLAAVERLRGALNYSFLSHIANSAAITRRPELQMDLVRLGIGMYGVDVSGSAVVELQPVATLKTTIAQLKDLKAGDTVSYNRKGLVSRDSVIATVRIGYADGYSRRFGNGQGKMLINGQLAPVIGTVCMDMTMIDVTDIGPVREGDEVIIFGAGLPVEQLAGWSDTIAYEIMTGISQRVKRVYYEE
jgi:Alr-MurF fusion protein